MYPLELQVQVDEKSNTGLTECCHNDDFAERDTSKQKQSSDRDNPTDCETINEFGRRKTFVEAQRAIHNCLKDNCYVIIFCPSRECQEDI